MPSAVGAISIMVRSFVVMQLERLQRSIIQFCIIVVVAVVLFNTMGAILYEIGTRFYRIDPSNFEE